MRDADIERHKTRNYILERLNSELPFRIYYAENKDEKILKILYTYFTAVRKVFVDKDGNSFWDFTDPDKRKPSNILQTTIGYEALLMLLKNILIEIKGEERENVETYIKYLGNANTLDIQDNNDPPKYPFANKTKNKFYNDLGNKNFGSSFIPKEVIE